MKVHKSSKELQEEIETLKLKIQVYESGLFDIKKLKYKIDELESEIIRKDNLIEGMKKIIEDLSTK